MTNTGKAFDFQQPYFLNVSISVCVCICIYKIKIQKLGTADPEWYKDQQELYRFLLPSFKVFKQLKNVINECITQIFVVFN